MQRFAFLLVVSATLAVAGCVRVKNEDQRAKWVESKVFDPKTLFNDQTAKALGYETFSDAGHQQLLLDTKRGAPTPEGGFEVEQRYFFAYSFKLEPARAGSMVLVDFFHYSRPVDAEYALLTAQRLTLNPWHSQAPNPKVERFEDEGALHGAVQETTYTAEDIHHTVLSVSFCRGRFILKISVGGGFQPGTVISPAEAKAEALRIARELINIMVANKLE